MYIFFCDSFFQNHLKETASAGTAYHFGIRCIIICSALIISLFFLTDIFFRNSIIFSDTLSFGLCICIYVNTDDIICCNSLNPCPQIYLSQPPTSSRQQYPVTFFPLYVPVNLLAPSYFLPAGSPATISCSSMTDFTSSTASHSGICTFHLVGYKLEVPGTQIQ